MSIKFKHNISPRWSGLTESTFAFDPENKIGALSLIGDGDQYSRPRGREITTTRMDAVREYEYADAVVLAIPAILDSRDDSNYKVLYYLEEIRKFKQWIARKLGSYPTFVEVVVSVAKS